MRPELLYEHEHTVRVTNFNIVYFFGDGFVEAHVVRQPRQRNVIPEPRQPHQHVTVITVHKRGVNPQVPGDYLRGPAGGERLPRLHQALEAEVAEVGLQQLLEVVAKFHVELALEDRLPVVALRAEGELVQPGEEVDGRFAEDVVAVVSWHNLKKK